MFYYDSEGKVYSMTKGDDTYFFVKNLQGDVTKIIDENGTVCATYAYDAWGGILATLDENGQEITDPNHIAFTNPFRYRGYVYDTETELYYLQSRYYDPKTGRFINADDSAYTDTYSGSPLSTNMFAYCENNHIMRIDRSGNSSKKKDFEEYAKIRWGSNSFGDDDKKINIKVNKNKIKITAYVHIVGELKNHKIKYGNKKVRYKTLIKKGIEKYWKGSFKDYTIYNHYKVSLSTDIKERKHRALKIKTKNDYGDSWVKYCRNKNNKPVWGYGKYGKMIIYKGYVDSKNTKILYTADEFMRVSAHEFGHFLGLDDLYEKKYKKVHNKYSPKNNIALMFDPFKAKHCNIFEIRRVIRSFTKNEFQYWN